MSSDPPAYYRFIRLGRGRKLHFQSGEFTPVADAPHRAKANCGPTGQIVVKPIEEDDELCSRCCWLGHGPGLVEGVILPCHEPKR